MRLSGMERVDRQWRKRWDSNPRTAHTVAGFQDQCLKPLGHTSVCIGLAGRRSIDPCKPAIGCGPFLLGLDAVCNAAIEAILDGGE